MSAESAVRGAFDAALRTVAGLNRVAPGASVRTTPPSAELGPIAASDWGTKDAAGRELRVTVTLRDLAERAERLEELVEAADAAIGAIPRQLEGWRVASLAFLRSRTVSEKAGNWAATLEYRVRLLAG